MPMPARRRTTTSPPDHADSWKNIATTALAAAIAASGYPAQPTRILVNHPIFANTKALYLYTYEYKTRTAIASKFLPAYLYIYATKTPSLNPLPRKRKNQSS